MGGIGPLAPVKTQFVVGLENSVAMKYDGRCDYSQRDYFLDRCFLTNRLSGL